MTLIIQKPTGAKLNLAKDYVEGDRNYSNVSLLLHGDGTNGSTVITDNSPSPKTVTAVGNAQISTAQSKFGGASILLDGSGDYLSTSASSDFAFGTANYTLELWFYIVSNAVVSQRLVQFAGNADNLDCNFTASGSGRLNYFNGTTSTTSGINAHTYNAWNHVALVRNSGTVNVYANGISVITETVTPNTTVARSIGIGGLTGPFFNGYIDEFRITKGVARYTSNFTPPTAPFPDI